MMVVGKPAFDNKGEPTMIAGTDKQAREYWHWGDMQLVRWYFSYWRQKFDREPLWPQIDDHNHGAVAGLQYYPAYKCVATMISEEYAEVMRLRWVSVQPLAVA
jgi:hypothetical protein